MMDILDDMKNYILKLLDEDENVRSKVKEVAGTAGDAREAGDGTATKGVAAERGQLDQMQKELAGIKEKTDLLRRQKEDAERQLDALRQAVRTQEEEFAGERSAWEAKYNQLKKERDDAINTADHWETECGRKDAELQAALAEAKKWHTQYDDASKDLKRVQGQLKDKEEELRDRFQRGWELFKQYPKISEERRKDLERVFFHEDDFASFICCGAQSDALEEIWDVMQTCWDKKAGSDLKILQEIFAYCIELVNSARRKAVFGILETKPGDKYDHRIHLPEPSSKAQGKVRQICVPGFCNLSNGKTIRQALVNLE